MVYNFIRGGAGINVFARQAGAEVIVADIGVKEVLKVEGSKLKVKKIGPGTKNMAKGPAMTEDEAIKSIEAGIELVEEEFKQNSIDIIGTGEMGIGNTTPASAITAIVTGKDVEEVTGRGTGISAEQWKHKVEVIKKAIEINRPDPENGLDVLAKVGGFEIGAMAGIMITGASNRIPVVIDGFISGAAALIACTIAPLTRDYLIASHCSAEAGHKTIFERLNQRPLLNLDLRLGEGTGAALAMVLIEAASRIMSQMATFSEAGVSERE